MSSCKSGTNNQTKFIIHAKNLFKSYKSEFIDNIINGKELATNLFSLVTFLKTYFKKIKNKFSNNADELAIKNETRKEPFTKYNLNKQQIPLNSIEEGN